MTQDVTQWLTEIKALQQQLAETQRDRDAAYQSAHNWQKLYETEAQQRRAEVVFMQQEIEALKAGEQPFAAPTANVTATAQPETLQAVERLQISEPLKQKLIEVITQYSRLESEVEQLQQALKTEQENHAQTRKSLTTALGDTVDLLAKERALREVESQARSSALGSPESIKPATVKNPSLELPALE